jgi:2-keto-3-deoxy-6-phosphogluconate aldolase
MLVESCLEAGLEAIEYTQRRRDAPEMIVRIQERYPELRLLVGSTIDDDCLLQRARRRNPQLRTLAELADLGVAGFISATGFSPGSIRRYCGTHLLAPTASTVTEAFEQLGAGAHFIKMIGTDLPAIARCRQTALFDICPVFVTGGITEARIPEAVEAGAVLAGAGFDVLLVDEAKPVSGHTVAAVLRRTVAAIQTARDQKWPELAAAKDAPAAAWLAALPHHHPFPV